MDSIFAFGIEMIKALQAATWLRAPMQFFSFLGTQEFFVFILPILYWCIDAGLGIRVGFILLLGNSLNEFLKMVVQDPRPYWMTADVRGLDAEPTFGAPSGHAQLAANVWGVVAARLRRPWAWIAALLLIFFIGISRLPLGVHFPQDVLLGWVVGALTLWLFIALWPRVAAWVRGRTFKQQLLLSIALSGVILAINGGMVFLHRDYVVPDEWMRNAAPAGEPLPAPFTLVGTLGATGILLGFGVGLALMHRSGGYKPSGPIWKRALSFLLGLIGILAVYLGLRAVFPEGDSFLASGLRMLRYAILGLWISAGAPWLFQRLRLTQSV